MHETTRFRPYCPFHYLCSDLLSIWLEAFGSQDQILILAIIIKTTELKMLSHIKVIIHSVGNQVNAVCVSAPIQSILVFLGKVMMPPLSSLSLAFAAQILSHVIALKAYLSITPHSLLTLPDGKRSKQGVTMRR